MSDAGRRVGRAVAVASAAIVAAAYPFLLVAGLDHASARSIGAALLGVTLVAAVASGSTGTARLLPLVLRRFGLVIAVTAAAAATNHPATLKLLPSLTNLGLLVAFATSLRGERSLVEQFAVASHAAFPDFLLPYCRRVTIVWCGCFAINGAVGAALALFGSDDTWAFYTGFVSYVLVGSLAAGEYVFHKSRFRFYEDGWVDTLWRRMLPPERTALGRRTLQWQLARAAGESRP